MSSFLEPFVLYELKIASLTLQLESGQQYEFPETLSNGRANYILFEELVRSITGLVKTTGSDHVSKSNKRYEQKAFYDVNLFPDTKYDLFQTSASSTFGANNNGPKIKKLIDNSDYESALKICNETGYLKNDFYIYTNTRSYRASIPFRYLVVPTQNVLEFIDPVDPRMISRHKFLNQVHSVIQI